MNNTIPVQQYQSIRKGIKHQFEEQAKAHVLAYNQANAQKAVACGEIKAAAASVAVGNPVDATGVNPAVVAKVENVMGELDNAVGEDKEL